MPETDLIPEPWGAFLRDLDEIATEPVYFYCIGGFVVTRKYGFQRETRDVDVLDITPKTQRQEFLRKGAEGSELHLKHHVYLHLVTVIEAYPEDYETRITEMYPAQLKHIRLCAPEAHDLALMKLGRNIERDREDVKFLARQGFITPEELKHRYEKEMRSYIFLPERYTDPVLDLWVEMIREEDSLGTTHSSRATQCNSVSNNCKLYCLTVP
jgi:Nucleotidyltransferase of unknown function (DUF6036)